MVCNGRRGMRRAAMQAVASLQPRLPVLSPRKLTTYTFPLTPRVRLELNHLGETYPPQKQGIRIHLPRWHFRHGISSLVRKHAYYKSHSLFTLMPPTTRTRSVAAGANKHTAAVIATPCAQRGPGSRRRHTSKSTQDDVGATRKRSRRSFHTLANADEVVKVEHKQLQPDDKVTASQVDQHHGDCKQSVAQQCKPASEHLLYDLSEQGTLARATILRRPSAVNRSPYVADVQLEDGRESLAHVPCLDMGGVFCNNACSTNSATFFRRTESHDAFETECLFAYTSHSYVSRCSPIAYLARG